MHKISTKQNKAQTRGTFLALAYVFGMASGSVGFGGYIDRPEIEEVECPPPYSLFKSPHMTVTHHMQRCVEGLDIVECDAMADGSDGPNIMQQNGDVQSFFLFFGNANVFKTKCLDCFLHKMHTT